MPPGDAFCISPRSATRSAKTFSATDDEPYDLTNKAIDAIGDEQFQRAYVYVRKADAIVRTRETASILGYLELKTAQEAQDGAADCLRIYREQLKLTGDRDAKMIRLAGEFITTATERIEDAKAWAKEARQLDKSYEKLKILDKLLDSTDRDIDEVAKQLARLKKANTNSRTSARPPVR